MPLPQTAKRWDCSQDKEECKTDSEELSPESPPAEVDHLFIDNPEEAEPPELPNCPIERDDDAGRLIKAFYNQAHISQCTETESSDPEFEEFCEEVWDEDDESTLLTASKPDDQGTLLTASEPENVQQMDISTANTSSKALSLWYFDSSFFKLPTVCQIMQLLLKPSSLFWVIFARLQQK